MDQIQSMRVFARVVEAGSFTRAAESLTLPKGTVTKLVQHLEARLRVRLLNRTTRRVTVTPDGAAYYERASRLLNDLDDIEASMTNAQANPSGRLRVDVGSSVARLLVIPALPDFFKRYPDIQLDLGVSDRPVDLISDNVDCVIRGGDLVEQSLVARRIGSEVVLVPIRRRVGDLESVFTLNEVGARVWDLCDATRGVDEIATVVAAEYQVDQGEAARDVRTFLREASEAGVIREIAQDAAPQRG